MTTEVTCSCGQRFAAEPRLAGQVVDCPMCGSEIAIPAARPMPGTERCPFCHQYIARTAMTDHMREHGKLRPDGQQTDYATLPPEERETSAAFQNAPRWYQHRTCGQVTGMPEEIIQTYLVNPWFYFADKTFCTGCGTHVPLEQCVWEETGEDLQTYTDRLRAAKPHMRPNFLKRALIKVLKSLTG